MNVGPTSMTKKCALPAEPKYVQDVGPQLILLPLRIGGRNDKILRDYGRAKRPESNGAKEGDERSKRFRREAFSRTTPCTKLEEGVAMK
ncbi:hypothetical protein G5I_08014 [Acromyrmex echinatior]|uniref:Uncharacterized protein n=1 Tax=Acromyrmex echinatior TaxID=103372 RepID=F4WQC5_ACREC|nr:hypothetical protein G5I_08014 [Acromyrmex echinatior]